MLTISPRLSVLALPLALLACDVGEQEFGAGAVEERCTGCSIKLNTNSIGAHIFSELDTTGQEHDGVKLDRVVLERFGQLDSVRVEAGELVGKRGAHTHRGADFRNSKWTLKVDMNGGWVEAEMMVTSVTRDLTGVYDWKYTFVHKYVGGPKEYYANCDKDEKALPGAEFDAVVTADITVAEKATIVHRENTIFIGCLSGGVGKAAYWGYPLHRVPSNKEFTAAVRMVRADYCGTGDSFTRPGQELSITDVWGINGLVNDVTLEALWDVNGAACVYKPRMSDTYDYKAVDTECQALTGSSMKQCEPTWDLNVDPNLLFHSAAPTTP